MINVRIKSGNGNGKELAIDEDGIMPVVIHGHPPTGKESFISVPFSQFFLNGTSNDMRVNGATNNVEFKIITNAIYDIYITSITIQISDAGARLDRFGAITALTNGLQFIYKNNELGEFVLQNNIQTNLDFFREATAGKGFGAGTDSWRADIAGGGGVDSYFPELDLKSRYGLPYGLRLVKGSTAELKYKVRDNITALDVFNIKAHGFILETID